MRRSSYILIYVINVIFMRLASGAYVHCTIDAVNLDKNNQLTMNDPSAWRPAAGSRRGSAVSARLGFARAIGCRARSSDELSASGQQRLRPQTGSGPV
jgi:hypothetical protein